MAKRKRYDDKFRATAVVMLEAQGYPNEKGSLERVSKGLGVPGRTLSRWFRAENNPPPDNIVREIKGELTDLIDNELNEIFKAMHAVRPDASYRDLGVVSGILADKKQLLSGSPTENTKTEIVVKYADS